MQQQQGTKYRSEQLEKVLRTLHTAVPGLKASVVVNPDGLLVSVYPKMDNEDQVAAMSATLVGLAVRVLRTLDQGGMKRLLIEAENGQMIMYPAGESSLAVLVEKDTKLGPVIFAASKATADIKKILGFKEGEEPEDAPKS
jgi:predicted regulator of Ras-like GTPase activity (Roadblock/LC7/MglB family)